MSILKPKDQSKTKTISIRVPVELAAQIESLRAEAETAGFLFDTTEIVSKTLAGAVKSARAELDAICTQIVNTPAQPPASPLTPSYRVGEQREQGGVSRRLESAAKTTETD